MAAADEKAVANETQILRQSWTSSARQVVNRLAEGKPVKPGEVEALQRSLENVEARELFEEARSLTRAGK